MYGFGCSLNLMNNFWSCRFLNVPSFWSILICYSAIHFKIYLASAERMGLRIQLEKPTGLVLEFEVWRLRAITDHIYWWTFRLFLLLLVSRTGTVGCVNQMLPKYVLAKIFWSLTASITMEVKNNDAHVGYVNQMLTKCALAITF